MIWLSVFLTCVLDTVFYFINIFFFVYPMYELMINK